MNWRVENFLWKFAFSVLNFQKFLSRIFMEHYLVSLICIPQPVKLITNSGFDALLHSSIHERNKLTFAAKIGVEAGYSKQERIEQ